MSDSEDEPITREKKPLSEARLAAIEKMKEGRRRSLEAKKKLKEEEKEAKKQMKKKIKMKVEEEMNSISSLPLDDEKVMDELKQKALEPVKVVEPEPAEEQTVEEEIIEIKQPVKKPRGRPKKKKIVVNNYYEDESSESEEEIVNNYHKKKRKSKKKPVKKVESSESEEEEIIEEVIEEVYEPVEQPQLVRQRSGYSPYGGAMSGISFR